MSGSVLVAKVRRDQKQVELDGTVRPGASIDAGPKTEVVILAMSQVGHLVDAAAAVARDLRVRGWQVTVQPYRFCGLEAASGIPATASAMVAAVVVGTSRPAELPDSQTDPATKPLRRTMTRWTSRRFRCDECGVEKVMASMTQHQRRTGHSGRTFLETVVIDKTAKSSEKPGNNHPRRRSPARRG